MYAQFFGSFLLSKDSVTPEQLTAAISQASETRLKLGTLALHKYYMTAEQVDEVCFLQTREDKRFGEIAIEKGYLREEQVDELLAVQSPDYLILGQTLIDMGVLSNSDLELLISEYEIFNEIDDMSLENQSKTDRLIRNFFTFSGKELTEHALMYINLVFNNLVRFIGSDFTPLNPISCSEEHDINYCVRQEVHGEVDCYSRIDMDEATAISFASRYAKMEFSELDEYVKASIDDFLNLHNGLFLVNMSNAFSMELSLTPPVSEEGNTISLPDGSFIIPVIYPFGTVHIIVSL